MRSVMKHQFSQVPQANIPRSSFDRSHGRKLTFNGGFLVPIFLDEALPGDTFNLRMTGFGRLSTLIFPLMDNLHVETFFFFVPNRLIWDNWQKFNGEQDNPGDSTDFLVPIMDGGWPVNSIGDYFGIPIGQSVLPYSALPFRAYNLIYNEWFRDQNLQNSVTVAKGDGPDPTSNYTLLRRGKRHDYFTSCLPWPQKGESVSLPLGTEAQIFARPVGTGVPDVHINHPTAPYQALVASTPALTLGTTGAVNGQLMYTDLSTATSATINSLRQAFQIQKLLERDARGGTRYTEIVRAHFGVISPDARLQRPEYLGGGSSAVNIQQVPQTSASQTTPVSPQGNLAAFGTVSINNHGFTKSFTEHGWILGLVNVRADLTYQYGLNRMWSRRTRYDFYWPALSHIGEQAVLNKEIYAQGGQPEQNDAVFGYQERYAEYRYKPSEICGLFRSDAAETLDAWHLAEKRGSLPVLNASFIEDKPPIERVKAVTNQPDMIMDCYFNLRCARPMPLYGVPGMIDHF